MMSPISCATLFRLDSDPRPLIYCAYNSTVSFGGRTSMRFTRIRFGYIEVRRPLGAGYGLGLPGGRLRRGPERLIV